MKKGKIAMGIIIFIIVVLLLIGVPICINLCFKPENRWTAGNVLTYYGTTLSFLELLLLVLCLFIILSRLKKKPVSEKKW